MALQIPSDIAAFGLFQIAFVSLDTRLSRCLVKLCRCENAKLAFAAFSRKPFSQRLQMIRKALKSVVDVPGYREEALELKAACDIAEALGSWRNARIHAEVRFSENQPVIVDEAGKPLRIDVAVCEEKIREAIRAATVMETYIPHLVAYDMDLEELMDD